MTFSRAVQLFQLIRQGTWLVILLALARSSMPLAEVGQFEALRYLGYVLSAPLVGGFSLAYLRIRQTTPYADRWMVLLTLLALLGGLGVIGVLDRLGESLARYLLDFDQLAYTLPFGIFLLGTFIGVVIEQEAIADRAPRRLLTFAGVAYGWQIVGVLVPLYYGAPMALVVWALASSVVPRLGFLLWRYGRTGDARLPPKPERSTFTKQSLQLAGYALFGLLVTAVDYYLVGHQVEDSEAALAVWRYGAQEIPLVLGIVGGINVTAMAEGGLGVGVMVAELRRRSVWATRLLMALAGVLMILSPILFSSVLGVDFYAAHVVFSTMLLVLPSRLIQTQALLLSEDLQRVIVPIGLAETAINVAVSLALLPLVGLLGIAIGTVVAYTFERVAYVAVLARHGHRLNSYAAPLELAIYAALLLGLYVTATDFAALSALG